MTERGIEVRRLDLELVDGVRARHDRDAPVGAVGGRAVDRPFVPADAAGRVVLRPAADLSLHQELRRAGHLHAGREPAEHRDVVAEHRQIHDFAVRQRPARADAAGVEQGRLSRHGDGLRGAAELELEIDLQPVAHGERQAGADRLLEARDLGRDAVLAGQQQGRFVVAAGVGRQPCGCPRAGIGDDHRDARQDPALRIGHGARNRAPCVLSRNPHAAECEQNHANEIAHPILPSVVDYRAAESISRGSWRRTSVAPRRHGVDLRPLELMCRDCKPPGQAGSSQEARGLFVCRHWRDQRLQLSHRGGEGRWRDGAVRYGRRVPVALVPFPKIRPPGLPYIARSTAIGCVESTIEANVSSASSGTPLCGPDTAKV